MKEEEEIDNAEEIEPATDNEALEDADNEDGEEEYHSYFNPKRSMRMVLGHREKKQFVFEQIVSKIKCYVVKSRNQFYIEKIRFDHPEPIAQLKKTVMSVNKAISHHTFFFIESDDSHTVYEQLEHGVKFHLTKSPNYHEEGYYLDKISLDRPISLNMFRNITIGCLYSSSRAIFRARDAAMLVNKDGDTAMFEAAYQTCGDKELSEKAVTLAHAYLNENPKIATRLEALYARQADKLSFFQKWFHL
jgi:hypothetical protein